MRRIGIVVEIYKSFWVGMALFAIRKDAHSIFDKFCPLKLSYLNILSNKISIHTKTHYANMSMQYTAIFHGCKNDKI